MVRLTPPVRHAIAAEERRSHHCRLLVSLGPLPGLPHHERDWSSHARSSPRCCSE